MAGYLRLVCLPVGRFLRTPSDRLAEEATLESMTQSPMRERYKAYVAGFMTDDSLVQHIEKVFAAVLDAEKSEKKLKSAARDGKISGLRFSDLVADALAQEILTQEEADQLLDMNAMRLSVTNVDDFSNDEITR